MIQLVFRFFFRLLKYAFYTLQVTLQYPFGLCTIRWNSSGSRTIPDRIYPSSRESPAAVGGSQARWVAFRIRKRGEGGYKVFTANTGCIPNGKFIGLQVGTLLLYVCLAIANHDRLSSAQAWEKTLWWWSSNSSTLTALGLPYWAQFKGFWTLNLFEYQTGRCFRALGYSTCTSIRLHNSSLGMAQVYFQYTLKNTR